MRMCLLTVVALLLAGCLTQPQGDRIAEFNLRTPGTIHPPPSPWLDANTVTDSSTRLVTPHGLDILQAVYFIPTAGQSATALLRMRDYSAPNDGDLDPQHIISVSLDAGKTAEITHDSDVRAVQLFTNNAHDAWALSVLVVDDNAPVTDSATAVLMSDSAGELQLCECAFRQFPLGYSKRHTLFARQVKAVQIDSGLPALSIDWGGDCWQIRSGQPWAACTSNAFTYSDDNTHSAGYSVRYDPVQPGKSAITYSITSTIGRGDTVSITHAYHVSYSAFQWLPPLAWVKNDMFATVHFLPDATGKSSRANYQGIFRLVCIDTVGNTTLVADNLPSGLPVVAGDGVVFYTKQQDSADGMSWELWAASADGMHKQRLWQTEDECLYLSVEDLLDGKRLLVQRQYLEVIAGKPELHSELREFSLDRLVGGEAELCIAPAQQISGAENDADDLLVPPAESDGALSIPPPLAIPD